MTTTKEKLAEAGIRVVSELRIGRIAVYVEHTSEHRKGHLPVGDLYDQTPTMDVHAVVDMRITERRLKAVIAAIEEVELELLEAERART